MGLYLYDFCRREIPCSFKGEGPVKAIKLIKKFQGYMCLLNQLRNEWDVSRNPLASSKNLHVPYIAKADSPLEVSWEYTNLTNVKVK